MNFEYKVDAIVLGWMADVMPNVVDRISTVVHNVLHKFCFIYEWQMLGHPMMNM